jgi:hypothetical protein
MVRPVPAIATNRASAAMDLVWSARRCGRYTWYEAVSVCAVSWDATPAVASFIRHRGTT